MKVDRISVNQITESLGKGAEILQYNIPLVEKILDVRKECELARLQTERVKLENNTQIVRILAKFQTNKDLWGSYLTLWIKLLILMIMSCFCNQCSRLEKLLHQLHWQRQKGYLVFMMMILRLFLIFKSNKDSQWMKYNQLL